MSYDRYQSAQQNLANPRETEYRLFAQVTNALMQAKDDPKALEYIQAIDWNRRLWSALQMDLMNDSNQLPDQLRAQLISLSIWVDKHSREAMRGDADLEPLIEVNRNIMRGLSGDPGTGAPADPGAAPAAPDAPTGGGQGA